MTKRKPMKSNKLTSTAWSEVQQILIPLFRLKPPHELKVTYQLPEHANRIRDWLYQYFREMNLKSLYRIRRLTKTQLGIQCISTKMPIVQIDDSRTVEELFFEEQLIDIKDYEDAREITNNARERGEITHQQVLDIMDLYRQVWGSAQETKSQPTPDLSALDSMPEPEDLFKILDESIKRPNTAGEPKAEEGGQE